MKDEGKQSYDIDSVLQEMREQYWQGLSEPEETPVEQLECVTFDLGGEICAFETVHAAEVIRMPRLVKVPKVQPCIIGAFNLRGVITGALDVRPMLGLPQLPISSSGRILVVKADTFLAGIVTERVREVAALPLSTFEPAEEEDGEFIRGRLSMNDCKVLLLDIRKLLQSPDIIAF